MAEPCRARLEIGKDYMEQNKLDLAIEQFKKICAQEKDNEQARFELAKTYYILKQYPLAIKEFKEAIRINFGNIQAHLFLAWSFKFLGEKELAIQEFKIASGMDAENIQIHFELGSLFKESRMYDSAISEYEKIVNLDADNKSAVDLIQLYNFQGKFDKVKAKVPLLLKNPLWQEPFFKNMLLNELEVSQKKLILDSRPRILLVTLTNRCNLNCYMCGRGENFWKIHPRIINEVFSWLPYLELITWQGGEVFLFDGFYDLLQKTIHYKNLNQIIITNALLIEEKWAEMLARLNSVDLTISIDGVDKETYEYIRQGASFDKLVGNLKIINRTRKNLSSRMKTTLRATIMKINYRQLEKFVEFANEYEFDVLLLAPLSIDCNSGNFEPQDIFFRKDYEALEFISNIKPKIKQMADSYKIKLLDFLPSLEGSTGAVAHENRGSEKLPLCFRPWKQLSMNVKGDIFPECICAHPLGNIFDDTLQEVWNNEKMQLHRKRLAGFNYLEWCNSDCVSQAIPPEHLKFTFA